MTTKETLNSVLAELRGLRAELRADPRRRIEPYTVRELATLARRHPNFISARCKAGVIETLSGKPYRIPPGAAANFLGLV
jgi:hypothetical protein